MEDAPASQGALEAAAKHGLDLSEHRGTLLTSEVVAEADLILTMSPWHDARVSELGGAERASLLSDFVTTEEHSGSQGVPDPIGGGTDVYEETYRSLELLIGGLLTKLEPLVAP